MMQPLQALLHTLSTTTGLSAQGGASPAWQNYLSAPYAHDTLAPLLGALSITVHAKNAPPAGRPDLTGLTNTAGDTITMYSRPNDAYFTHEIGHILDVRNIAPEISSQVARLYDPRRKGIGYAATNDFEYTAEAFRNAMALVRKHGADIDKHLPAEDKRLPGTALWVKWIQQKLAERVTT